MKISFDAFRSYFLSRVLLGIPGSVQEKTAPAVRTLQARHAQETASSLPSRGESEVQMGNRLLKVVQKTSRAQERPQVCQGTSSPFLIRQFFLRSSRIGCIWCPGPAKLFQF